MKRKNFNQNSLLAPSGLTLSIELPTERPATGICVKDGEARNNEKIVCAVTTVDFKLLSGDTNGDLSVFISANNRKGDGPPLHVHQSLDEFFCVLEGEFLFQVGDEQSRLKPGDTMFVPRTVSHAFNCVSAQPGKLLVTIQPASNMEEFFRGVAKLLPLTGAPDLGAMQKLYAAYDSTIVGPPVPVE
ncbi:MAG: cupin domain-containing protein [Chryseolinea sp.]